MSRSQIESIRKSSKAGSSGPWVTHWDEMARKTALRRVCKYLTLSPEVNRAVALEDRHEAGVIEEAPISIVQDIGPVAVEPTPSALDQISEAIEAEEVVPHITDIEPVEETDPEGRKAKPKRKRKARRSDPPSRPPRKISAAKVKKFEESIRDSDRFPPDVHVEIKERFGAALANLTTDDEESLREFIDEQLASVSD
jgi:recombinational DNA repair protein RecT